MPRSLLAVACAMIAGASLAAHAQSESPRVPLFDNLGSHHYAITTTTPLAQRYFDQGLRLYYGFNHAESIRAFEEATRQDPDCAMCYWGIAVAYGPNINAPMERRAALAAYDSIQKAIARAANARENERALIRALAARYAVDPPEDRSALDAAYTRAMRDVVRRYPTDLEAATLLAEALMDQSPWKYWTAEGKPRPDTPELLAQLERVMAANPNHPGANHFYIHAVEAVQPERALAAAERLAALMPGAGHIVHMPGHIYVRVGRYLDAIEANEHAIHADETYIRDQRPASGIYTAGYYPHNYDFLAFAASMIGRSRQSIGAAEKLPAIAPAEMLRAPGMTFLQHHRTRHLQMKVRFSRWDHILAVPAPDDDLPHAAAIWNYARGRALAARGDGAPAEAALERLRAAAADPKLAEQRLEFNTSGAILAIATEVLTGHIAASTKDFEAAVERLRAAAKLEDALTYGEPPDWSVPVRQELGMVLLRAERPAEAAQAFREDLKRFPENGWSLRGLELALRAQNRIAEADTVKRQFDKVWATADVEAPGSKSATQNRPPIIDMHLHADLPPHEVAAGAPSLCRPEPCEGDSGATGSHAETQKQTLAMMDRYNIVKAFLSGVDPAVVQRWVSAAPDRFIAAPFILKPGQPDPASLRQEYAAGRFTGLGEIATQLTGVAPNDPALEPYFALAEKLDVPVLIHTAGIGPYLPGFRSAAGTPLLLEDVLVRHPKLRLFVENAGYPFRDQMIAVMTQYPQLHADVSTITWVIPREAFYDYLQALVTAGLGKRLMFGSDQMRWPEKIGEGIAAIEQAPFLTEAQKRDILYHNAARFLRLDADSQ